MVLRALGSASLSKARDELMHCNAHRSPAEAHQHLEASTTMDQVCKQRKTERKDGFFLELAKHCLTACRDLTQDKCMLYA